MNGTAIRNRLEGLNLFLVLGSGHFLTLLGSAMSRFALGVWVYQTTGQVQDFATVLVVGFLPGVLITPLVGVWVDRKGPRRLVLAGDILGAAVMVTVFIALLLGAFTIPHLLLVTAALSCASALQGPSMLALIPGIVPAAQVSRANGLFQAFTSASDVLGPILAGVLLAMGALPVIVGFDLITYGLAILVTLALWAKLVPATAAAEGQAQASSWRKDIVEGFRYVLVNRALLYLALLFTLLNFGIGFNLVLVPPFVLSMGSTSDLGVVNAVFGLGMFLGGLLMSVWKINARRIPLILWACAFLGAGIAVSGLSRGPLLVGAAGAVVGFLVPVVNTPVITVLQLKTKPSHLGRVFALLRMLAWIFLPAGQLLAGKLADTLPVGLPGPGKQGVYGLLLLATGLFMVLTTAGYTQVKSLSVLDEEGVLELEAA